MSHFIEPFSPATVARLLDAANDLKSLPRMGWLLAGVNPAESVADHSFATTLLALSLAEAVNRDPQTQGLEAPLSVERVLKIALLHDLAESIVTDLPKRATEAIGEEAKHRAERSAWERLAEDDTAVLAWMGLWEEYEQGASPEARLVRDADKLEMIHQALRYAAGGNQRLEEFHADREWAYPLSGVFRQHLLARAGVHISPGA